MTDLMSHSQFHRLSSLNLDMHGLIFERLTRWMRLCFLWNRKALARLHTTVLLSSPPSTLPRMIRVPPMGRFAAGTDYILSQLLVQLAIDPPTFSL